MHPFPLCLGFVFTAFTLLIIKANEQILRMDNFEQVCKNETSDTTVSANFISEQRSRSVVDCCVYCREGCHGVLYKMMSKTCYVLSETTSCPPAGIKYLCRKQYVQGMVTLLLFSSYSPIMINIYVNAY